MVASKTNRPSPSVATPERTRSRTISKSPSSTLRHSPRNHDILDISDSDDPSEIHDSQDSQAPKTQQCRLVSWIWNHGYLTEDEESWRCARCNEPLVEFKISSTTHAGGHLRRVHDISIREQGSKTHAKKEGEAFRSQAKIGTFFKRAQPSNEHRFKSRLIEWVLRNRISFHQVETQPFRQMVEALRPEAVNILPSSANTLRKWLILQFKA